MTSMGDDVNEWRRHWVTKSINVNDEVQGGDIVDDKTVAQFLYARLAKINMDLFIIIYSLL